LNDSQRRELSNDIFYRSTGSFELVLSPAILGFLGFLLDRAIGTVPIFTILFALAGIAGAACRVYYGYRYAMAELEAATKARRETEPQPDLAKATP
jgi:F0F1-type ATP synthase assembly protein I